MSNKPLRKVQLVRQNQKEWPYIGNALDNSNGSVTIFLDRGVSLVLPTGEVLSPTDGKPVKLLVKLARPDVATAPEAEAPPAVEPERKPSRRRARAAAQQPT